MAIRRDGERGRGSRGGYAILPALPLVLACVLAVPTSAAAEPSPPSPGDGAAEPPAHHGSAFLNPLGFLLFGPTLGAEVGVGHLSATVYGRWFNAGLLARSLFLKGPNDSFDFSYGAGLRGRYYFWGNLAGPHVGVALEYLTTRIEDSTNLIATNAHYLVPEVEGGYRLGLGRFYVGAAAALGYAFELSSSVDDLPGGTNASSFVVVNESKFYGDASLDLGLYF